MHQILALSEWNGIQYLHKQNTTRKNENIYLIRHRTLHKNYFLLTTRKFREKKLHHEIWKITHKKKYVQNIQIYRRNGTELTFCASTGRTLKIFSFHVYANERYWWLWTAVLFVLIYLFICGMKWFQSKNSMNVCVYVGLCVRGWYQWSWRC